MLDPTSSDRMSWDGMIFDTYLIFFLIYSNINIHNNNNDNNNNDNCGIAAPFCGIFSCTNSPVWPVGGVMVAGTAFLVFIHHIIVFHCFSLFFDVLYTFFDRSIAKPEKDIKNTPPPVT